MLVEVEPGVGPARGADLVAALRRFKSVRQRDGAIRWEVWEDMAEPGCVIESFVVESWLEHERQHDRVTNADRLEQEILHALQIADGPAVRHLLRPQ